LCGTQIPKNETYLITGTVYEGKWMTSLCRWIVEWGTLSENMVQRLTERFDNCTCLVTGCNYELGFCDNEGTGYCQMNNQGPEVSSECLCVSGEAGVCRWERDECAPSSDMVTTTVTPDAIESTAAEP